MNLPFPKGHTRQVQLSNWPPERERNCAVSSPRWLHLGPSEQKSMASVFSNYSQCLEKKLMFQQLWLQIIEIDLKTCSCLLELTTASAHLFFAPNKKEFSPRSWHWALCLAWTADRSAHHQQNKVNVKRHLRLPYCSHVGSERPQRQEDTKQGGSRTVNRLWAQERWQTLICGASEPRSHGASHLSLPHQFLQTKNKRIKLFT